MNARMRLILGGLVALTLTAASHVGTGPAHAAPLDSGEICRTYQVSRDLAAQYGVSRREATIAVIAGYYEISVAAAERAFDAADC